MTSLDTKSAINQLLNDLLPRNGIALNRIEKI